MKEIWKMVPGYDYLMASNLGKIKTIGRYIYNNGVKQWRKERIRNPQPDRKGYVPIKLDKVNGKRKQIHAHRLVAKAFLGDKELEVNHKNGIKHDNRVSNLEYVTPSENCLHAIRNNIYDRKSRPVVVVDTQNNDVYRFKTLRKCADFFRVTHGGIAYHIGRDSLLKGRFKIFDQNDFGETVIDIKTL